MYEIILKTEHGEIKKSKVKAENFADVEKQAYLLIYSFNYQIISITKL